MKHFLILGLIGISFLSFHLQETEARIIAPLHIVLEDSTIKQNSFITANGGVPDIIIQKGDTVSFPLTVNPSGSEPLPVNFFHSVEFAIPDTRQSTLTDMKIELDPFHMVLKPDETQIMNVTITALNYTQLGEHKIKLTAQYPRGEVLFNTRFDVLVMNENPYENYKFIDFSYAHIVGEPIKFILEKIRDDNCNSYNVTITDENETFVWGRGADISCDSDNISNPVMYQTKIGYNKDHPIIINNSGKYYLEIESADALIKQEFVVRQNHSGISLDRTVYPTPNPDPLDLWNSADVIIDGTVIEVEYTNSDHGNNVASYHIKANKYFKGVHEMGLLFAQNDLHVSEFDVNDNGLFYLKSDNPFGYVVQSYSVKTFGNCNARDLIEISPVLPHEGFSLSAPTLSESYFDPCVANYFTYDPDFFSGILDRISPLKQAKHGISNDLIRCYDDLILVHKYDDSTACVENETKKVLVERGWAKPDIRASTE